MANIIQRKRQACNPRTNNNPGEVEQNPNNKTREKSKTGRFSGTDNKAKLEQGARSEPAEQVALRTTTAEQTSPKIPTVERKTTTKKQKSTIKEQKTTRAKQKTTTVVRTEQKTTTAEQTDQK